MSGSGGEDRASGRSAVETGSTGVAAVAYLSHVSSQGLSMDDAGGGSGGATASAAGTSSFESQVSSQGLSMDDAGGGSGGAPASAAGTSSLESQVDHVSVLGATDGGSDFLLDALLSWTMEEATDGDLYKSEIKGMPAEFRSINDYKQVQSDFLIEEIRARVHFGIKQIENAEFYQVLSVLDADSSEHLFFDIDVAGLSRHRVNHSAKDGDIFLLTMHSPADVKLDNSCFLGMAMEIGADNAFQKSFRMLVSRKHDRCVVKTVKFVSFLTNIAEELNISRSISFGDFKSIKLILEKNESYSTCCSETGQFLKPDRYNRDQIYCTTSIMTKLRCEHENSVQLVWGSPGTGKTFLACTLINLLINSGTRIVVCVPTERKVLNLLRELKSEFPEFEFNNLIVLNGLNGTCSETCLPERCHKLYCAVHLWKSFTKEMAWILGLEIYMPKVQLVGQHKSGERMIVKFSFSSFKSKFVKLLKEVERCSNALISSLSGKGLTDQDVNKVNNVISTLLRFQELLENNATNASHVQIAFGIPETHPCPSNSSKTVRKIADDLNDTRIRCIELINDLLGAVMVPELDGWKDLEQFCIEKSQIVVCTPDYSSQLHNLSIKPDILIVDDAAHIRESALLVPLSTAPRHILLIGDHLHVQPTVENKVCKDAGYGKSLFERLINLSFDKKILREQHMIHPVISKLHGQLFYVDEILDGLNVSGGYNDSYKDLRFGPYHFLDISDVEELRSDGKGFTESSVIIMLLEDLCKGLTKSHGKFDVGIVCLCSRRANALEDELCMQYEGHNNICIEVISIDKLHKWYDIAILSLVCNDPNVLLEGNRLNVVLSCARHCLWIIGEVGIVLSSNEALEKLYHLTPIFKIQSNMLYEAMQRLKMINKDCPVDANATSRSYSSQMTGQEHTWKGRPYRTKNIMPPVRDQKDDRDTCTLITVLEVFESSKKVQYADLDPPKDFEFSMSLPHLKEQYEQLVDSPFLETDNSEKGRQRLETEMMILQKDGVKGYNKIESMEGIFKISRYEKLERKEKRIQFSDIKKHLRSGKMLACHFRISSNYFYLKPGECYEFDEKNAYIHPISWLPVSHAVMGTGFGLLPSAVPKGPNRGHVTIQNSEGARFGYDGSGKVMRESLRGAYIMSPEEDLSTDTNKQSTSVEGAPGAGVLVQVAHPGEEGPQ